MTLIRKPVPNFVNGVSQQPPELRLPSQAEAQENCLSSVVDGLIRRPSLEHVARLKATTMLADYAKSRTHLIDRDGAEQYQVVVLPGDLEVYDLKTGAQRTVAFPDGKGYLASLNPKQDFRLVTAADYTFVANRTVTAQLSDEKSPALPNEALIFIRATAYAESFSISITYNGQSSTFVMALPNANTTSGTELMRGYLNTDLVASNFAIGMMGGAVGGGYNYSSAGPTLAALGLTAVARGPLIKISGPTPGPDFVARAWDSNSGDHITYLKGKTQRFSDLPKTGWPGFTIKIQGDPDQDRFGYWVTYKDSDTINGVSTSISGGWSECAAPSTNISFDAATLPHVLVSEADGSFTFKRAPWDKRTAGDEDAVPHTSFVGNKINDLFYLRGRLGFLTSENVVTTRSGGENFNFWRKKASQVLDTDPIDIGVTHNEVSILTGAATFDESLLVFSKNTQFRFSSGPNALSPKTVELVPVAEYANSDTASPHSTGASIYFATSRDGSAGLMEYSIDENGNADAQDRTEHVPSYIPGELTRIASSSSEHIVASTCTGDPNAVYVYVFRDLKKSERAQASWSRWSFGVTEQVVDVGFLNTDLYILSLKADGLYLSVIHCAASRKDLAAPTTIHLDHRLTETKVTRSYDAGTNRTTITLPYPLTTAEGNVMVYPRVLKADAQDDLPASLPVERLSDTQFRVPGNPARFFIGLEFTSLFVPSQVIHREDNGNGGSSADTSGRVQVRRFLPSLARRSRIKVEAMTGTRTVPKPPRDRTVSPDLNVTYPPPTAGFLTYDLETKGARPNRALGFGCPGEATDNVVRFRSVGGLPFGLLAGAWEVFYTNRTRQG